MAMRTLTRVKWATDKARAAQQARDDQIRIALGEGHSVREVAVAAGLSPARIHQIQHGR